MVFSIVVILPGFLLIGLERELRLLLGCYIQCMVDSSILTLIYSNVLVCYNICTTLVYNIYYDMIIVWYGIYL